MYIEKLNLVLTIFGFYLLGIFTTYYVIPLIIINLDKLIKKYKRNKYDKK